MAKASLISKRSTSSNCQPNSLIRLLIAPTGAMVNCDGCMEWVQWPTIRASGSVLSRLSFEVRIKEDAPSEIDDEFAAVIVPSTLKAGRNDEILSSFALPGCSSSQTVSLPISIGLISACNNFSSIAYLALCTDWVANSSMSWRVNWYSSAVFWAKDPMDPPVSASSKPSKKRASCIS